MSVTARRLVAWLILMAFTPGCAVLRVDVDVYRGPLANHEEVQAQQFAAMAIGAKPLLIRLRDFLIGEDSKATAAAGASSLIADQRTLCRDQPNSIACWHRDDFIRDDHFPPWVGDQARQVNAVLSLYVDHGDPDLAAHLRLIQTTLATLRAQKAIFYPEAARTRDLETQLRPGLVRLQDVAAHFGVAAVKTTGVWEAVEGFQREFGEYVYPGQGKWRNVQGLREAYNHLAQTLAAAGATPPRMAEDEKSLRQVSVWTLTPLTRRDTVERLAGYMFRKDATKESNLFTERVIELARAETTARTAIREMWEATLQEIRRAAAGLREDNLKILAGLAGAAATLVKPRNIAVALAMGDRPWWADDFKSRLAQHTQRGPGWDVPTAGSQRRVRDVISDDEGRRAIELALLYEPRETSSYLLTLDDHYRRARLDAFKNLEDGLKLEYELPETRVFGLIRASLGTTPNFGESLPGLGDVERALRKIEEAFSSVLALGNLRGFEQGRLSRGLPSLINDHLQFATSRERDRRPVEAEAARELLTTALVQFSEKVLIIANNEVLFRQPDKARRDPELDRYVLVLQAVGNAIQIHADELTNRAAHTRRLGARADAERVARERVFGPGARDVLDNLVKGLEGAAAQARSVVARAAPAGPGLDNDVARLEKAVKDAEARQIAAGESLKAARVTLDKALAAARPVVNAHRSLGATVDFKALSGSLREADETTATLRADVTELRQKVATGAAVSGKDLAAALAAALKARTTIDEFDCQKLDQPPAPAPARQIRLRCAQAYFTVLPDRIGAVAALPAADRAKTLAKIDRLVREHFTDQVEAVQRAAADVGRLTLAGAVVDTTVAEARKAHEKARQEAASVQAAAQRAQGDVAALDTAAAFVREHRARILSQVESAGLATDGGAAYAMLLAALGVQQDAARADVAKAADADKKGAEAKATRLEEMRVAIEARRPLIASLPRPDPTAPASAVKPNQRDVLDDLIAVLRHEHLRATAEGAPEARVKSIGEALRQAYEQRGGMAYIRPAGAYLRSSYAATELQDDPGLRWENMLWGQAARSIPVVGSWMNEEERRRIEVISSIDKQFWQNINRVRLAAAGNTNYAVAKDDIGNWYVKAFSGDAAPIIRSAQRLALFASGASLNVNFLRRLDLQRAVDTGQANEAQQQELLQLRNEAPGPRDSNALQRVFERYRREYVDATGRDAADLRARLASGKLVEQFRQAWQAQVRFTGDDAAAEKEKFLKRLDEMLGEDVPAALADATTALTEPPPATEPKAAMARAQGQAAGILRALGHVKRVHDRLTVRIATRLDVSDAAAAAKAQEETVSRRATELTRLQAIAKERADEAQAAETRNDGTGAAARERATQAKAEADTAAGALDTARAELTRLQQRHSALVTNRAGASAEVSAVVRSLLGEFVERRRAAVEALERSVVFIGEASRP